VFSYFYYTGSWQSLKIKVIQAQEKNDNHKVTKRTKIFTTDEYWGDAHLRSNFVMIHFYYSASDMSACPCLTFMSPLKFKMIHFVRKCILIGGQ